jgi:hypothetical protein
MMVVTMSTMTLATIYFFYKVLTTPPKAEDAEDLE